MGSFNLKGFLSNVSISYGDDIVVMVGKFKDPVAHGFYPLDKIVPVTLPVYGKYNDYGNIESIIEDDNTKWIRKNIGDINDFFEAADECQNCFLQTIENCIKSTNPYHPNNKVRPIYDRLIDLGFSGSDSLCLLVEHRYVYENWPSKNITVGGQHASTFIDKWLECDYLSLYSFTALAFGNDSQGILKVYENDRKFLKNVKEEVVKLQDFVWHLVCIGRSIRVPMQYSQDDYYDDDIQYHKKCIELIKKLKKDHSY